MLSQHTVWILIVSSVCREAGVFLPSDDINGMNTEELRSAAMGWYRWVQVLEWHRVRRMDLPDSPGALEGPEPVNDQDALDHLHPLSPASGPVKITLAVQEEPPLNGAFGFRLIPGGRFLVVAITRSNSSTLAPQESHPC